MHKLNELKEKLIAELEDYADNGKFFPEDVKNIKGLSASVDHLCNIDEGDDYSDRGMSYDDGMGGYYTSRRGYSRNDGTSMARGRMNARRDSMGRYSRADGSSESVEDIRHDVQRLMDKIDKM